MEIIVRGRNMEVPEEAFEYARRKIERVLRRLEKVNKAEVEIGREATRSSGTRYIVQVTLDVGDSLIRSEKSGANIPAALDSAVDVLKRQIDRYKGKCLARRKEVPAEEVELSLPEEERKIVRVKRFPLKPMSPDEAVIQMELLDHDFFFFLNADTGKPSVVYRRRDGNYGLIEPE